MKRNLADLSRANNSGIGRVLQEAFDHGIDNDIIQKGLISGGSKQGIYEVSATKNYELGSFRKVKDGRSFVYCLAGAAALAPGAMCQSPAPTAGWETTTQAGFGFAAKATTGTILTTTTVAANAWADGYMAVTSGTNVGQMYRIVSNTAHATEVPVVLADAVVLAIAVADTISVIANPCNGTIIVPAGALTSATIGVPLVDVPLANYYWSQVRGIAPLLVDTSETIIIGECVGIPATASADGACGVHVTTDEIWGRVLSVSAAAAYAIIDLTLI